MHHRITRTHEICYGHRVVGHEGKCAHLHGHGGVFSFTCEAPELDAVGRIIDFSVIKSRLCQWLEDHWDHRMLIWDADPLHALLRSADREGICTVPFNPTAENMAQYLVEEVGPDRLLGTGVRLARVSVQETSKCSATYGD